MRRFLCCLGVFGLLAGGGLLLPGAASAFVPPPCIVLGPGATDFAIAELPLFQIAPTLETYQCVSPVGIAPGGFDISEQPGVQTILPMSDNITFAAGGTGIFVNLHSDTNGIGLDQTSLQVAQEVLLPCLPGTGPEPGSENPPGLCNGADHVPLFDSTGAPLGATLTVYSDIAAVPEPSTGLLLGAALPALLGLRRRSIRVSA